MPTYLVACQLKAGRDYADLHAAIKAYGTWAHPLEPLWAVVTEQGSAEIRDNLARHMDPGDGLLIVRSADHAAWRNIKPDTSAWLNERL